MAEPFTIYKLTILNMLDKVDFPLTNTQISDFFLEQEYTDYFRVQQVLNDLADSGLIRTESTHSNTQYYITGALPVPRPRHQPDRPDTDRQKQRAGGSDL